MFNINVFVSSFLLYTFFRIFDVESTRVGLAGLDPEMHEINPLAAPLIKRIGFYKTMFVTWLPFAAIIGLIDTLYTFPIVGIPILWLVFGLFHLIAAASNLQLYFQKRIFGSEIIEVNTYRIIKTLKEFSIIGKVVFLMKMNFLNIFLTFYGIGALVLFSYLLSVLDISLKGSIPILLAVGPPIMIFDLILFFPTMVFGSVIISWRRIRIMNDKKNLLHEKPKYLGVSIECLENALSEAQAKGAKYVQFLVPSDE